MTLSIDGPSYFGAPPATPPGVPAHLEKPRRHPWEIGLLVLVIVFSVVLYLTAGAIVLSDTMDVIWVWILATPVVLFFGRGLLYGRQRVNGVKMSPTQFPEGYALVVEAAQQFGLSEVPDAYVVLGNGVINAAASGHGFRRYVVVYSDLFEIGGRCPRSRSAGVRHWPRGWSHRGGPRVVLAPAGSAGDAADPVLGPVAVAVDGIHRRQLRVRVSPRGCPPCNRRTERRKVSAQVGGFRRHGRPGDIGDRILRLVGQHAVLASGEYLARGGATQPCRRGLAVFRPKDMATG